MSVGTTTLVPWPVMHCWVHSPGSVTLRFSERCGSVPQLDEVCPFKTFFSTASGYGTIELGSQSLRVQLLEGSLSLEKVVLTDASQTRTLEWKTTLKPGAAVVKSI